MDTDRWHHVEQLCHAALERGEDQQAAFLESACAGDHALRREVESLLAHRTQAEHFIEAPALEMAAEVLAKDESYRPNEVSRWIGRVLSDYRIVDKVSSGGMGEVYGAVRADGTYEKQVAIKLVQSGLGTDYFLARFRNERQILASLDHPNIAKLIDGGSTEEGLPYVVMEYIEGQRIDEYCEQRRLDIPERLNLFRTVCSAVQYAHKNLVVHRDLKPGNILVTQDGVPKLLDFGIAKILHAQQESQETRTVTLMPLLTPDYASPEQVRNEAITTSSDVYSLGVVLYVLLTGHHPHKSEHTGPHDLIRAICEAEPKKPSTAVALPKSSDPKTTPPSPLALAIAQREESKKLRRALAGDLDNIVLKALRKEPERRYASVEQFSEDIRRHLVSLPVIAHKDTLGYRARKFVSRNKLGVGAVALVILSLLAGFITTLREARIARLQRALAEQRFNDVRKIANSLLFDVHDSIQTLQGATSARKLIVQLGLEYLDRLSAGSAADPSLGKELAAGYQKLGDVQGDSALGNVGDLAGSIASYRKAAKLRDELNRRFPGDPAVQNDLAKTYQKLGQALQRAGNQAEGDGYLEKAFQIARIVAKQHPNDASVLYNLGVIQWARGGSFWRKAKIEDSLQSYRESAETFSRVVTLEPDDKRARRSLAIAYKYIGGQLEIQKRLDEALSNYRAAFNIDQGLLAQEPESAMYLRDSAVDLRNMGDVLAKQKGFKEALQNYESSLAVAKRLVKRDPTDRDTQMYLALAHEGIGDVLLKMGKESLAIASLEAALKVHLERNKADASNADTKNMLAQSYVRLGDAYATLAQSATQSRRIGYLEKSCSEYRGARTIWNAMQQEGTTNKFYEADRSSLLVKIRNCN